MARILSRGAVFLILISFVFGCTEAGRKENFVKNADFAAWKAGTPVPDAWNIEGNGLTVKKADLKVDKTKEPAAECAFAPEAVVINSPFFYTQAKEPSRLWGKRITAGAWVKTSAHNAVAIELSNRAGIDVKSTAHTGGGQWEFLSVSWTVPQKAEAIELRLRFSQPAVTLFGGPVISEASLI